MSLHDKLGGILDTQVNWEELEESLRSALSTNAIFGPAKSVVDIGEGSGFASLCGLITCDWKGAEEAENMPSCVALKIPSALPFRKLNDSMPKEHRMLGEDPAMWETMENKLRQVHNIEVATYEFLEQFGGLKMPKKYYAKVFMPEDQLSGHICLEYMNNSRVMNYHEEHTVEQVQQIARALGRIQACSLKKEPTSPEFFVDFMSDYVKSIPLEAYCGVYKGILAVDSSEATVELMAKIDELLPEYYGSTLVMTIHKQMGFKPVMVNGDLRTENVLIDKDTGDLVALIDWQCTHLGVGVVDLLRIMLFALTTKDRRASSAMLIEEMYNSLVENLDGAEPPYALEKLQTVYDILFPHCALYFAAGSIILINNHASNPSYTALSMEEKEKRKAIELDKVLGAFEDILLYHGKNKELVKDLKFRND
ncbi:hypothetical protein PMAYCL1PPCAC_26552 [Pristionchus mayeri]|uniref:CHK kinase-like domain-containing protein n=1 Tax=Pristionchus mayeri TaxID=1317129 RepID=A0AAN5D5C8_9BILA|nr:hypothetical protein PMAYCL1PPCAC_26552 [Pristionchus mayeri]